MSTPCQVFEGPTNRKGYGCCHFAGRRVLAHRLAYALHYGEDPGAQQVMHHCDNPPCVNPEHLTLGTNAENVNDKVLKGRQHRPVGDRNPNARIREDSVVEIRRLREGGASLSSIALHFGVTKSTIWKLLNGRSWRHV